MSRKTIFLLFGFILIGLFLISLILFQKQINERQSYNSQEDIRSIKSLKNKIIFVSERDGDKEIYLMDEDGTNHQALTNNQIADFAPTFSPDYQKIAYLSQENIYIKIYLLDFENNIKNLITATTRYPYYLLFSPDGQKLLYLESESSDDYLNNHLLVVNIENKKVESVASGVSYPLWTSDSKSIIYVSEDQEKIEDKKMYIRSFNREGELEEARQFYVGGFNIANLDSNQILFLTFLEDNLNLASVDLRGENFRSLANFNIKEGEVYPRWFQISPDESTILFNRLKDFLAKISEIWTIKKDGSELKRIITDGFNPTWSPDGSKIIFTKVKEENSVLKEDIWSSDLDGLHQKALTSDGKSNSSVTSYHLGSNTNKGEEIVSEAESLPLVDLKIPSEEVLILSSQADTNGDGEEEILVITKILANQRIHFYILGSEGQKLFDKPDALEYPLRIELRKIGEEEYDSFFLVFTETGEGFSIHWNGEKYIIPESEKGF